MSSSADVEGSIHNEMNRLRGRLCGLIESWGLDERRETACKQTLKSLTYDSEKLLVNLTVDQNVFEQECTRDHRCTIDGPCNGLPRPPQFINGG